MKNLVLYLSGISAIAAFFIARRVSRPVHVEELAHKLELAWADHHTVV